MISSRDIQYFAVATSLAKVSSHHKARLGAIIVQNREVISAAHNITKSHPLQMRYNVYRNMKGDNHNHHLHAEINAIVKVQDKRKLKGATIYVSRVLKDHGHAMARPCPACMKALRDFGIKNIFYTTDQGFAQEIIM